MTTPLSEERLAEIRERWERADACVTDGVCLHREGRNVDAPDYEYVDCDVPGWMLPYTPEAWAAGKSDIADLLAEVERLRSWLRECDQAFGGDGSDDSLLGLVYTCGAGKDALAEVTRLRSRVARLEGVLRSVEWEGDPHDQGTICPVCRQWWHGTGHDHAPDCALDAALRDAHE